MGSVRRLIARFEALSVGDVESGSDQTVQGTASSPADMPQTLPQDPCSSSPHPYLLPMLTEETGIGRQAGPSDHNIILLCGRASECTRGPMLELPPCAWA